MSYCNQSLAAIVVVFAVTFYLGVGNCNVMQMR